MTGYIESLCMVSYNLVINSKAVKAIVKERPQLAHRLGPGVNLTGYLDSMNMFL